MSGGRDWMEGVPCRVGNETPNIVVIPVHSRRTSNGDAGREPLLK